MTTAQPLPLHLATGATPQRAQRRVVHGEELVQGVPPLERLGRQGGRAVHDASVVWGRTRDRRARAKPNERLDVATGRSYHSADETAD